MNKIPTRYIAFTVLLPLLFGLSVQAQRGGGAIPAPTITGFTPTAAAAGQTVTITGTNFTGATAVSFGGTAAASFSVVDNSTITAIVDAGNSGVVSVTTNYGKASTPSSMSTPFIHVAQPTITSFTASHQTVGGAITIYGTGFNSATDIKIGGTSVLYFPNYSFLYGATDGNFIGFNDTVMTVWLGNSNTSGDISITNPLGTASISGFTVDAQPNNIWTGGLSEDFSLAANWSNGVLPFPNATITIPYGTHFMPVIFRDTTLYKINLEGGIASISSINNGYAPTTITLKDSISGNGFINQGSVIVDGNIGSPLTILSLDNLTIKSGSLTIDNGFNSTVGYNYGGTLIDNLTVKGGTLTTGTGVYSTCVSRLFSSLGGTLNTNANLILYNDAVVTYPLVGTINGKVRIQRSIPQNQGSAFRDLGVAVTGATVSNLSSQTYSFSGGSWSSILSSGTSLVPGKGYRAQINTASGATVLETAGTLVTTSVSPTITQGANAFSFVANPYVAQLDFTKLTTSNLQSGYWYLDPTNLDSGYQGYAYYGTLTGASNTYSGGIGLLNYIQPQQGFFVQNQNNNSASSLTFSTSAIDNSQPQYNVFGTSAPLNRIATGLFKGSKNVDGAVVVFNSSFSGGIDQYDGVKFSNNGENLTFKVAGKDLCANAWSMPKATDALQMHLYNLVKGTIYALKLNASQFVGYGVKAYLKDNLLQTQTLLSDSTTISFSADSVNYNSRFSIVFGINPLSVKSITLTATQLNNKQASINWSVAGANSVSNYQVERSVDGTNFTTLTIVNAGSSSNFSFQDATATDGVYYRIKATDNVGVVSYSNVVRFAINYARLSAFAVYPNPVTNSTISYMLPTVGKFTLNIINSVGKTIYSTTVNHTAASALERIQLVNKLAAGIYTLRATDANSKLLTTQVIIK